MENAKWYHDRKRVRALIALLVICVLMAGAFAVMLVSAVAQSVANIPTPTATQPLPEAIDTLDGVESALFARFGARLEVVDHSQGIVFVSFFVDDLFPVSSTRQDVVYILDVVQRYQNPYDILSIVADEENGDAGLLVGVNYSRQTVESVNIETLAPSDVYNLADNESFVDDSLR